MQANLSKNTRLSDTVKRKNTGDEKIGEHEEKG